MIYHYFTGPENFTACTTDTLPQLDNAVSYNITDGQFTYKCVNDSSFISGATSVNTTCTNNIWTSIYDSCESSW